MDLNHQDPLVAELHREILQWGERRHLTDPWLLDVALLYLRLRHRGHPWDAEDPFVKGRFPDPRFVDTDEEAEFVHPGWHPMWEPWSTYEKKVRRALAQYRSKREAWAKSQGMKPGVKKRGVDVGKHFKWLARYQIGEKSYETMAKDLDVHPTTVAVAIRKTAELIGLTLRDVSRGGRKPTVPK
ncbi:MAG: hypothetical protein IID07_14105 [Gemmatimonadetes bacterium]|nr:hypothetical protein [Gemmatimonadota bacterium]